MCIGRKNCRCKKRAGLRARPLIAKANQMKKLILILSLFLINACSLGSIPARPDSLGLDEIKFSRKEPETWTMANGLVVYYMQNDELPQVGGTLYFPGGEFYQPAGRLGLSGLTGALMREGGIRGMSPEQFDKRLNDLAASIETGFSEEYGTASFFSLEDDFEHVFSYFSEVVLRPAFSASRLALIKGLSVKGIQSRKDDPDTIADSAFKQLIYGAESPYARMASSREVQSITMDEIKAFHASYLRPNGAYFALSGSLPKDKIKKALEKYFGNWEKNAKELPKLPPITKEIRPAIYLLKRDFDQARIYIGHRGPERIPPDLHAMIVFNQLFGHGSFGSLLFSEIRSRLGLAYTVYGGLIPDNPEGMFEIYIATRVEETAKAIKATLALVDKALKEKPESVSFEDAKSKISRSFVFKFTSPGSIVQRAVTLKMLGYPDDYDQKYLETIAAVSEEGVLATAKKYIDPSKLVIVIVGRVSKEDLEAAFGGEREVREFTFDEVPRF